jgi:L-alanine-DL-glutamate epimerase-like enolase superfamily enzyme
VIITDVEALHLRQPSIEAGIADGSQDALIVRVHTDSGIVGLGEVDSLPTVVKAVIDAKPSHSLANGLRSLLIGQNPLDIAMLWARMYRGTLYFGRRGAVLHAMSGIDIALWDIAGKATGLPIHQLLGGKQRDSIAAYASTLMPDTPAEVRAVVQRQLDSGYRAIKLGYGPLGRNGDLDVALVAAAREAAGDDVELMLDVGLGWTSVREAIERARRMEPYRLAWIEEPFAPDELEKYAALSRATSTPLAAGEQESTLLDFERIIDRCGIEVVQPDVTRAGGISEVMRIADLTQRRGRRCVLHSWSTGIIKAASLQVLAAIKEAEYFEDCVQTTPLNERLTIQRPVVRDGRVLISDLPGLGVELDEDVVAECLVKGEA